MRSFVAGLGCGAGVVLYFTGAVLAAALRVIAHYSRPFSWPALEGTQS